MTERRASSTWLRSRLAGGRLWSTFVKLESLEVIDLLAASRLDAIVVDLEHSQLDEAGARRLIRHAAASGLPAIVRIPEVDRGSINRLLEAGAAGIQLSTLTSLDQARALVASCRYPPAGRRSVSLAQPGAGYGARSFAEVAAPDAAPLVVGQIETAETVDPLTDIVGLLDVAFVGVTDLSVDLGEGGSLDGPRLAARIGDIAAAASAAGVGFGGWIPSLDRASLLGATARHVTFGSDLGFVSASLRQQLSHSMLEDR